jgi:ribosome-associated toxin RatA of RatAB toxin-antitoxin module
MLAALRATFPLVQLLLCSTCGLAGAVTAATAREPATAGWTFVRHVDDLDLYRRPVKDSDTPALLGRTRFRAPLADVFSVISDYDHFAEFIPLVSESRVLERNAGILWVYQRLGLPLLVTDRHYIIKIVDDLRDLAAGGIAISWQLDKSRSASLASADALLPAVFSGYWQLSALPDQAACDAVYSVHVEPGGSIPGWLFARVSERYVVQVINAVRKRIAEERRQ